MFAFQKAFFEAIPESASKTLFFGYEKARSMKKIIIKAANGCSVCAWLLTSGGFQLSLRLRRNDTLALRARAPTKRTHCQRNNVCKPEARRTGVCADPLAKRPFSLALCSGFPIPFLALGRGSYIVVCPCFPCSTPMWRFCTGSLYPKKVSKYLISVQKVSVLATRGAILRAKMRYLFLAILSIIEMQSTEKVRACVEFCI